MNESLGVPVSSADSAPFWEGTTRRSLLLQQCGSCHKRRFPPSLICPACHCARVEWLPSPGAGHVHSFTIVRRAPSPAWRERVPYVIALIDLADGVRMMGNIEGPGALEAGIGDPVWIDFEVRGPLSIPQFRLSGPPHGE